MKTAHITSYLSNMGGGIPVAMRGLTCGLSKQLGEKQLVVGWAESGYRGENEWEGVQLYSMLEPSLLKTYLSGASIDDGGDFAELPVFHVHGLWSAASLYSSRFHKQRKTPYVVSPHGMLDPWAMRQSSWKKRIAMTLFERQHLSGASCLHALSNAEADAMRDLGFQNRIEIIPNGVDLPILTTSKGEENGAKLRMLFLGRLHPKKA